MKRTSISRLGAQIIWHVFVLFCLLGVPGWIRFKNLPWDLPGANRILIISLASAYALAACLLPLANRYITRPRELTALLASATALGFAYLAVLMGSDGNLSRPFLLAASALVPGGLLAPHLVGDARRKALLLLATASIGPLVLLARIADPAVNTRRARPPGELILAAHQHTLRANFFPDQFRKPNDRMISGGAITREPGTQGYLLVRSRGDLYRISFGTSGDMIAESLSQPVPINTAEFEADLRNEIPTDSLAFRVADILAYPDGDLIRILVSHHYWNRIDHCFVVRVSSLDLPTDMTVHRPEAANWRTVYQTQPCLHLQYGSRGKPFVGIQIGGNLERLADGQILLTVGDHQFDGWFHAPNLVQNLTADYGKTIVIDPETRSHQVFTLGHRNPQGLTIDAQGRIWETEHGPRGGDELNLLQRGANYGYPYHSYGTDYGNVIWPPADGLPPGFTHVLPAFAWVPSIGISDLISIEDAKWPRWQGDLLIASLRAKALWRVHMDEDRIAYAEPIQIGERVRDIAQGQGEFVLWTDQETIVRLRPTEGIDSGAEVYALQCSGCHDDVDRGIGPELSRIVGRRIASISDFDYSEALRQLRGNWTADRIDKFLENPSSYAPGTTMTDVQVTDPDARRRLIEYLDSDVFNYLTTFMTNE